MEPTIGVLFVHGIGEQEPGATIVEWGEVLRDWLDEWGRGAGLWHRHNGLTDEQLRGMLACIDESCPLDPMARQAAYSFANPLLEVRPLQSARPRPGPPIGSVIGGSCELSGVSLTPPASFLHVPAGGQLTFRSFRLDGIVREHRLQLAEAHWASVFPVPRYGEFFRWATVHLPLILQAHLGWGLYQARAGESPKWRARVSRSIEVAGWYALSILLPVFPVAVLALLAITGPLAFAPFDPARKAARRINGIAANVLGDIYVLLERPSRAAAIRERVRASYVWLADRCDSVIVVAHSQGAAVALDFLVEERPSKAHVLVTLGSGARKLAHLRFNRQGSESYGKVGSAWLAVIVPGLVGLVVYDLVHNALPSWLSLALVGVSTLVFLVTRWHHGSQDRLQESKEWRRLLSSMELPWYDFSARNDPVSNGEHVVAKKGNTRPHSLKTNEVQNRGSLLSDHTTYWENTSQFVPRVVEIIADRIGLPFKRLTPHDSATLSHAWFSHGFRVSCLRLGRTFVWLALLHAFINGEAYLTQAGSALIDATRLVPDDWVPNWVVSLLNGLFALNFGKGREWLAGAVTFALGTFAVQTLWLSVWRMLDSWAATRMFRRNVDPTAGHTSTPPDLLLFAWGVMLVVLVWREFFRWVPAPALVSVESALAALLLLLNLKDLASCGRFISQSLRSTKRKGTRGRGRPPAPGTGHQ